jgi:hypothetical protein
MTQERKIIQIAAGSLAENSGVHGPHVLLYALCNDGTVWETLDAWEGRPWVQVPPIPQPEPEQ